MQHRNDSDAATQQRTAQRRIPQLLNWLILSMLVITSAGIWFAGTRQSDASKAHAAAPPPQMGINIQGPGDSNPDFLFADTFRTYRLQAAPGQSNPPSVDSNGWPQGDFTAFLWDGAFLPRTTGTYKLRFNGSATINLKLVSWSIENQSYNAATNTTTADVIIKDDSSPYMEFTNTKRTNGSAANTGITNIQMMRPVGIGSTTSYSFDTTFTNNFKTFISNFSVIRFMDYLATNGNTDTNWSDRTLPNRSQQVKGAWEYAIQLCNETGKNGYINIPERATSDYITQLAKLIKYGSDANGNVYSSPQSNPIHPPLNSNLHLYIEYSNEVWNGMFLQFHDNYDSAVAEVQAGSPLNYDGETNSYVWGWRRIAKRIHDISNIFRSVFGDAAMPPNNNAQIRPVFEWQYGNSQNTASQGLTFLDNYYGNADGIQHVSDPHPVNYFLWGGGGAAYSGVGDSEKSTVDEMYNTGYSTKVVPETIKTDAFYVHAYGLKEDIAYEGGFQIGGDRPNSVQLQANLDPRAQAMQVQTQKLFSEAGGDLLMYFSSTGWNYGLAQPTSYDTNTAKMKAIYELQQSSQYAPTNGTILPATVGIDSGTFVTGNRVDTLVNSPAAGVYSATLNLITGYSANKLQVLVNNAVVQVIDIPKTSQQTSNVTLNAISLPQGLSGVSVRGLNSTNTVLYSLVLANGTFTPTPGNTPVPPKQAAIANATTAPNIDGNPADSVWSQASSYPLNNAVGSPTGFSATFQSGWDSTNLYMLVKVQDTTYSSHANAIEVYIDPTFNSGGQYDSLDMQYVFPSNGTTVTQYNGGRPGTNTAGIVFANANVSGGYQTEIKIPWTTLGVTATTGKFIGLEIAAQQNPAGSTKAKLFWNTTTDNAWTNPSSFGNGVLQGQGGGEGGSLFATGFESGDVQPTWNNTVDSEGLAGGLQNVTGICCGLTNPEVGTRTETAHTGSVALMYSGQDTSASGSYAYLKVLDLSGKNVTVGSNTQLDYWIYPQTSSLTSGSNSTCIAVDLIFSDGSNLRDSVAVDQGGNRAHPEYQCNHLALNNWNHVVINLGSVANGKTIVRINVGYDQPGNIGGYRGYIDDITIHNS